MDAQIINIQETLKSAIIQQLSRLKIVKFGNNPKFHFLFVETYCWKRKLFGPIKRPIYSCGELKAWAMCLYIKAQNFKECIW
jgi:hypothetical protein